METQTTKPNTKKTDLKRNLKISSGSPNNPTDFEANNSGGGQEKCYRRGEVYQAKEMRI
jgi:hypothetical protein